MTDPTRALEEKVEHALRAAGIRLSDAALKNAAQLSVKVTAEHLLSLAPEGMRGPEPQTAGPWSVRRYGDDYPSIAGGTGRTLVPSVGTEQDAAAICHCVNTHPTILAALVAAQQENARLRRGLEVYANTDDTRGEDDRHAKSALAGYNPDAEVRHD